MAGSATLFRKIEHTRVGPDLKDVLWGMAEEIELKREQAVEKDDFSELKAIVLDLAWSQQRTERRVEVLAVAQQRTERRMEILAQAQEEMSREVARVARLVEGTNSQVAGLARSVAYALENEAYRQLPKHLSAVHRVQVTKRFIRTNIGEKEVNFFANAKRDNARKCLSLGKVC